MSDCREMKKGQVYHCPDCGLELEVVKECNEAGKSMEESSCKEACELSCCGTKLELKS